MCHIAIQNYSYNYMNTCSIITIIIIKIIIRHCLLQFKAVINPPWFQKNLFTKKEDWECLEPFSFHNLLILLCETPVASDVRLWDPWVCLHLLSFLKIVIDICNNLLCLWHLSLCFGILTNMIENMVCSHDIHVTK